MLRRGRSAPSLLLARILKEGQGGHRGALPVAPDLCRCVSPVTPEERLLGPKAEANEKVPPPATRSRNPAANGNAEQALRAG